MASRRKTKVEEKEVMDELAEKVADQMAEQPEEVVIVEEKQEEPAEVEAPKAKKTAKKEEPVAKKEEKEVKEEQPAQKYRIGSVVFVSKDAQADLNGFKLFAPYKKYTYTVEAYNSDTGVYSLRRLNLSLKLKEADIVAPHEKSRDSLTRRQF